MELLPILIKELVTVFISVIGTCWFIFNYIQEIKNINTINANKIKHLEEEVQNLKIKVSKYINNNTNNISDVEKFLETNLGYQPRTKNLVSKEDL